MERLAKYITAVCFLLILTSSVNAATFTTVQNDSTTLSNTPDTEQISYPDTVNRLRIVPINGDVHFSFGEADASQADYQVVEDREVVLKDVLVETINLVADTQNASDVEVHVYAEKN